MAFSVFASNGKIRVIARFQRDQFLSLIDIPSLPPSKAVNAVS